MISIKTLFILIEQDSQCKKWESKKLGKFKCSKPEPMTSTKETIKKWNNGINCREKCLDYVKVMGDGCCEAKPLSHQMAHPKSTTTNSPKNFYQTECTFRSRANVERIGNSQARTYNEDQTLACEGTLKERFHDIMYIQI